LHYLASLITAGERIDEAWEVIVVDDTPPPDDTMMAGTCLAHGAKYIRGPWRVGSKRSLGAAAATFDIVLFVDSDCKATPELLLQHLRSYRTHGPEVGAVVGPTEMFGEMPFVWRVASHAREYNVSFAYPTAYQEVLWGTGSNFSFRHTVFDAIGGYDEDTITVNGGEDVDIGIRTCEKGYRIISNRQAVVLHTRENITRFRQIARKVFRYGRADIYLCLRHPKRTAGHLNPLTVLSLTIAASSIASVWLGPVAMIAVLLVFLGLWGASIVRRLPRRPGIAFVGREALCILLDWSFDAGNLYEAIRQCRPALAFHRFHYLDPSGFIPFQELTGDVERSVSTNSRSETAN
jgi:GT2 family glycosyltransferase